VTAVAIGQVSLDEEDVCFQKRFPKTVVDCVTDAVVGLSSLVFGERVPPGIERYGSRIEHLSLTSFQRIGRPASFPTAGDRIDASILSDVRPVRAVQGEGR